MQASQCIFDHHLVFRTAQEKADAGPIVRVSQLVIDGRQIEIYLADESGIERHGFELDDHEASQLEVVEEQVHEEVLVGCYYPYLAANKRKPIAKLEHEALDVINEGLLDLAFTIQ